MLLVCSGSRKFRGIVVWCDFSHKTLQNQEVLVKINFFSREMLPSYCAKIMAHFLSLLGRQLALQIMHTFVPRNVA